MVPISPFPSAGFAWCSDLHLNFVPPPVRSRFYAELAASAADVVLIAGDISDARGLEIHLTEMALTVTKPVFFVLGNHDRYHGSVAGAEAICARVAVRFPNLIRLSGREIIELSGQTALTGVDGWADGLAGSGSQSKVVLNDSIYIKDLATCKSRAAQFEKMGELSRGFTEHVIPSLYQAMEAYPKVIFLTHVPPLIEATWHEGKRSEPDFLPHFSNPSLGERLREACAKFPDSHLTVLCGHTHGGGLYQENNMTVFTAPATYGKPQIEAAITVE